MCIKVRQNGPCQVNILMWVVHNWIFVIINYWRTCETALLTSMVYVWSCVTVSPLRRVFERENTVFRSPFGSSPSFLLCSSTSDSGFFFFFFCFFWPSFWAFLCRYSASWKRPDTHTHTYERTRGETTVCESTKTSKKTHGEATQFGEVEPNHDHWNINTVTFLRSAIANPWTLL